MSSSYSTPLICVIEPLETFDSTPPPTKYFIVMVVLDGDVPYVFVLRKLVGSNDSSNLEIELGNPNPTFLKEGIIVSSLTVGSPLPNWIVVVLFGFTCFTNLRDVLSVFKI